MQRNTSTGWVGDANAFRLLQGIRTGNIESDRPALRSQGEDKRMWSIDIERQLRLVESFRQIPWALIIIAWFHRPRLAGIETFWVCRRWLCWRRCYCCRRVLFLLVFVVARPLKARPILPIPWLLQLVWCHRRMVEGIELCFFSWCLKNSCAFFSGGQQASKASTLLFHSSIDDFKPSYTVCLLPDAQNKPFLSFSKIYIIK